MTSSYFLGANSKNGFHSLYSQFPTDKSHKLHIIKGGPGSGKSSFMHKIGLEAEKRGLDVEYVLCSGDPDSLDGVYIPALGAAWADGTAPHVLEPGCFCVDADYVNLGVYCSGNITDEDKVKISALNAAYKGEYERAYHYLAAAAELKSASRQNALSPELSAAVVKRAAGIIERHTNKSSTPGRVTKRYISAVSCRGRISLTEELQKLCKLIYQFEDGCGLADAALSAALDRALSRGLDVIVCPSPLEPDRLEALLLPSEGLALLAGDWGLENFRRVRLDTLADLTKEQRRRLRSVKNQETQIIEQALESLSRAKALHDELEAVYKPYMDFKALNRFTRETIKKTFVEYDTRKDAQIGS